MDVIFLLIIFAVMILILKWKKPLWMAATASAAVAAVLFRVAPLTALSTAGLSLIKPNTLNVVVVIYLLSIMQQMMERSGHFDSSQKALTGVSDRLRANMAIIPMFMGILPSPGAVLIAAPMVDEGSGDYLSLDEKTFVTSYYRHIPEAWLPTYSSIIIALTLSGVSASAYFVGMSPMIVVFVALGFVYLRKLPKHTGIPKSDRPLHEFATLFKSLWCVLLIIVLILVFNLSVVLSILIGLALNYFVERFQVSEIWPTLKRAFHLDVILSTFAVMMFADVITATGAVHRLPALFEKLPLPPFLIFSLIFFFGTIFGGMNGMTAMTLPIAFSAMPDAGMPLLILLMCVGHAASQLSPTHICLTLVTQYFNTELQNLLKKTLPISLIICAVAVVYYLFLTMVLHI